MLKKIINNAQIDIDIIPVDPLLIKSGQATVGGVDMSFVRTYRFGEKEEPFIPGSSLKGMIRSYAEKICRSLKDDPVPVCLPYLEYGEQSEERRQASCGLRLLKLIKRKTLSSSEMYRLSCPACRFFGSHVFAGRFAISDAYLTKQFKATGDPLFEHRDGVAIDRITGGAAGGAKYDLEVLTSAEFCTTLEIRNFERWQLGLVGLILRDMEQGLLRIGFGKSRGMGRFQAKITKFKIMYYKKTSHLSGLAAFCPVNERNSYGLFKETVLNEKYPLPEPQTNGLHQEYIITDMWKEILTPAVNDLAKFVEEGKWPEPLEQVLLKTDQKALTLKW